jgi:hypothetical protein
MTKPASLMASLRRAARRRNLASPAVSPDGTGASMIYMVEMDMNLGDREAEWHDWYIAHIKVLLTVPGFRASQRFKSLLPAPAPYLALHHVDSGAVFESPEYRAKGGPA